MSKVMRSALDVDRCFKTACCSFKVMWIRTALQMIDFGEWLKGVVIGLWNTRGE